MNTPTPQQILSQTNRLHKTSFGRALIVEARVEALVDICIRHNKPITQEQKFYYARAVAADVLREHEMLSNKY